MSKTVYGFETYMSIYFLALLLLAYISFIIFITMQDHVRERGILYVQSNTSSTITQTIENAPFIEKNSNFAEKTHIMASKNGTKYYYVWCVASQIKPENMVYFKDEMAAEATGLTKSSRCQ